MPALPAAGGGVERDGAVSDLTEAPTADDLRALARRTKDVRLDAVLEPYTGAVTKVRDLGVALSDRRAVKVLKLVAASAVLAGRDAADPTDLWVLRPVWDRAEQIGPLAALVAGLLDRAPASAAAHPRAARAEHVDPEALARDLDAAERDLSAGMRLVEAARLRERLQAVADRAAWVPDAEARSHLVGRVTAMLEKL